MKPPWSRPYVDICVVVTADASQQDSSSAMTSLDDDDVKQVIVSAHAPVKACARERQSVITDAREALASSAHLRESSHVMMCSSTFNGYN